MFTNGKLFHDYRRLLRHLKKLPSFGSRESSLRSLLLTKIQANKLETNEVKIKEMRRMLNSYVVMVTDIRELKHLRELDSGEKLDPREKIKATASRVGLSIPKFADENFKET